MKCPMCVIEVRPSEISDDDKIIVYDCPECFTSWHRQFMGPRIIINEESTLYWLVTCESHPEYVKQVQVPGQRKAVAAIAEMMQYTWDDDKVSDSVMLEFTASADPQHPEYPGLRQNYIVVKVEITGDNSDQKAAEEV